MKYIKHCKHLQFIYKDLHFIWKDLHFFNKRGLNPVHLCIIKPINQIIMKKLFILSLILCLAGMQLWSQPSASTTNEPANPNAPKAKWDKTINDFGEIAQGIPKAAEFKLTNEGKEPLIIQSARASCGCTNLKYSQEPILPGKSTIISATYNAAAAGAFIKTITVTTNADPNPVILQIKGTVAAKPVESK